VPHLRRPALAGSTPVHVTLRLVRAVGNLRRFKTVQSFRDAFLLGCEKDGFRICQFSVQRHHIHLVCEADSAERLARGVQGFEIRAARRLNRRVGRKGRVFSDRYHSVPVRSPRHMRSVLCYVLQNARRHRERIDPAFGGIDPFSSAFHFDGWAEEGWRDHVLPSPHGPPVAAPAGWLLCTGWRRHGLIGLAECPPAVDQPRHAEVKTAAEHHSGRQADR
jgi:REP-associated tyrosine transposase